MIPERYIELIHQEVDGGNSPEESRTLQAFLADHAEARALLDDLRRLDGILGRVDQVEPPPGLKASILAALPEEAPAVAPVAAPARPAVRSSSWGSLRETLAAFFAPRPMLAFAYTFALGALVGIGVFTLAGRGDVVPSSDLVGAIGVGDDALQEAGVAFRAEGFEGAVASSRRESAYVLTFNVDADEATDLQISYDPSVWSMMGYRAYSGESGPDVDIREGRVTIRVDARHQLDVMLRRRVASENGLQLSLLRAGEALYDTTFTP